MKRRWFRVLLASAAWGLIGGLIYLCYRPSQHAKFVEVEREVHEVEHEIAEDEEGHEKGGKKDDDDESEDDEKKG